MRDDRFRDLCIRRLLSELEGEELEEFRRELEGRGKAGHRELDRLRETLGGLALSAGPVDPPPELRERLMGRIAEAGPGTEEVGGVVPPERLRSARERRQAARGGRPWGWVAAAGIAAATAGVLGVWNLQLRERLDRREAALEAARERIAVLDSLGHELGALESDLQTLVSPAARTVTLGGTDARPEASARVFVDPVTGRALVFAYELPILPPDSVYQLWAIRGEEPASAGTFSATGPGPARMEVSDPELLDGADALAVTVEPAPGVPAPTGEMVLISSS